jgi:hypothetical protein
VRRQVDSKALSTQRQMWPEDATIALLYYEVPCYHESSAGNSVLSSTLQGSGGSRPGQDQGLYGNLQRLFECLHVALLREIAGHHHP